MNTMSTNIITSDFIRLILKPIANNIVKYATHSAFCISNKFYTYQQLGERISAIRNVIRHAKTDEPIWGLAIQDNLNTYASIIALWMEGKAYVPLHPSWPQERNQSIINQVGLTNILDNCNASFEQYLLDDWKNVPSEAYAYLLFTSGSTGAPKGVPLSRTNLASFIEAFNDLGYNLTHEDRCLQCFDLTFDLSVVSYVAPLIAGACIYTIPYDKIKWSYTYILLEDYELTYALMTPSTIQYLRPYMKDINLPKMRYSLFCGEALPTDITAEWAKCIPNAEIDNVYGPTENTIYCTRYRFRKQGKNVEHNGILSIGTSMTSGKVMIIDDNNQEVHENTIGELCLSGKQLTQGYWKNPEKNADAFFLATDGTRYYRSGDLCIYGEEGNILFVGRKDTQVKINGYRIELGEIECHTRKFLEGQSNNVLVMAYEDEGGLSIGMIIEQSEMDIAPLINYLKTMLPPYMLPKKIIFEPNFPLNSSNKIDRSALKQLLTNKL